MTTNSKDDELREDFKYHIEVYDWNVGYRKYMSIQLLNFFI